MLSRATENSVAGHIWPAGLDASFFEQKFWHKMIFKKIFGLTILKGVSFLEYNKRQRFHNYWFDESFIRHMSLYTYVRSYQAGLWLLYRFWIFLKSSIGETVANVIY